MHVILNIYISHSSEQYRCMCNCFCSSSSASSSTDDEALAPNLSEYERERLVNIKTNGKILEDLGIKRDQDLNKTRVTQIKKN